MKKASVTHTEAEPRETATMSRDTKKSEVNT